MSTTLETQLSPIEERGIELMHRTTYENAAAQTGLSVSQIWRAAARVGARKHEEQRTRRIDHQRQILDGLIGETAVCDVLDFFSTLPDDSLQMVSTSIPYNLGKSYGGTPRIDQMRHLYYYGWMLQVISEISRTLKPDGVVFMQLGTTKDDHGARVPLDVLFFPALRDAGLTFQNRVVWPLHHGLTPRRRLAERYETALIFSKGPEPTFNPAAARRPQKNPRKRAFHGTRRGELSGHPLGAFPTDNWSDVGHLGHNHPEKTAHPCQFPVALVKRAMLLWTRPGDLVADPFCGSGSSQIAALQTGRAFVGADLYYEDLRRQRLADALPDLVTPLPGVTPESTAVWSAEARRRDVPALPMSAEDEEQLVMTFC
jgi:DNA modification methylase